MRVQVNLSDDLVVKIDRFAEQIGLSRSAVCAYWIGQSFSGIETGKSLVEDNLEALFKQISLTDSDDFVK